VVDPESVELSESYATTNGALVAHYPSDFVAKRLDEATVVLSRRLPVGDETVTLGVLPYDKAATDDIEEFARLMLVAVEKNVEGKGGTSTRGKGRDAMCLGKYEGIEFEPTFSLPDAGDYVGKACFFEHNERAHIVRYDVVASQAEREIPLLERIINATELSD
jgi:hypothetical protein